METTPASSSAPAPVAAAPVREHHDVVTRLQASDIFRNYQQAFQSLTGLPLVLREAGSFQAGLSSARGGSAFCALMAAKNKTCAACLQLQGRLESAACTGADTQECFAGLNESAIPVRVGENVVAYLLTGQVHFQAATPARFRRVAREIIERQPDANVAALEESYLKVRTVTRTQYDSIIRLLEIFAQQLSSVSNQLMLTQAQAESPTVARARAYIAANLSENLTLRSVARAVGMSPFYFCKNFKKGTGLTFTGYLSRIRVEGVKQLLLNPHKRVSEAAYEVGFQSLSQFNRRFLQIAGESPSAYRERIHSPAARSSRLAAA